MGPHFARRTRGENQNRASPVTGSGADSPYQGEMSSASETEGVGGGVQTQVKRSFNRSLPSPRPRRRFAYFAAAGKAGRARGRETPPSSVKKQP